MFPKSVRCYMSSDHKFIYFVTQENKTKQNKCMKTSTSKHFPSKADFWELLFKNGLQIQFMNQIPI